MKRYSILLFSLLSVCSDSVFAKQCIDAHQLSGIGKDLKQYTKQLSCPLSVKSSDINWVMDQELPKLINKQFLGVEPPADWQNISKLLILSCYSEGDLCDAKIQKEVGTCLTANGALLLVKYGSWLSDNCETLQNNVVNKWQEKKTAVYQLIDEIFTRINPPLSNK